MASAGWMSERRSALTTVPSSTTKPEGIIKIPADGLERLAAGELLSFEETYVRTTPKFETADERYAWLAEVVAVGYNILSPNHIDYRIYWVL